MFGQHSHDVREALVDGDVQRCAHGVVEEVDVRPFAQQQPRDLCLVPKRGRPEKEEGADQSLLPFIYCWSSGLNPVNKI